MMQIIENVLAQGAYAIRRRFGSWDIASRLLDLSLHSRNASIQVLTAAFYVPYYCYLLNWLAGCQCDGSFSLVSHDAARRSPRYRNIC